MALGGRERVHTCQWLSACRVGIKGPLVAPIGDSLGGILIRARCPRADGDLKPTERVSDALRPSHTGAERIASERVSDESSTCKGR